MNDEELYIFITKIISFIEKWERMYAYSRSNSITKAIDFFFTNNTDFHIVFL